MFPAALLVAAHSLILSLFRLLALPSRIHQLRQDPQDGRHPVHPAPHPSPLHLLSSISSHHLFFSPPPPRDTMSGSIQPNRERRTFFSSSA